MRKGVGRNGCHACNAVTLNNKKFFDFYFVFHSTCTTFASPNISIEQ